MIAYLTPGLAASVYAALNASSLFTRFAVPVMADYFGSKKVMVCCFSLQTLPILLLFFAQDVWTFFLFAILFGIGVGGEVPIFPVISRQYYGHAPMGGCTAGRTSAMAWAWHLGQPWGDSSGPRQATIQGCSSSRSGRAWQACYLFWSCPAPPAVYSPTGRSNFHLRPARG